VDNMRADRIARGELKGQPPIDTVVSVQEKKDKKGNVTETRITFHSGDVTVVGAETDVAYSTSSFEDSTITKTKEGFRAEVSTIRLKNKRGWDGITVNGKVKSLHLEQKPTPDLPNQPANTPINLFVNGELVDTGKSLTWPKPLLERPAVQAGLGVVGLGVATGFIGRWLNWW